MWELQVEIEPRCALNCVHCSSLEMRQLGNRLYSDNDLVEFLKLFDSATYIYFTGGEPINYSNLPVLCSQIRNETNDMKMGLYSTGNHSEINYMDENLAKKLKDSGIDDCYFSIYSNEEKEHDDWTGVRGSFVNTIYSINSTKKVGIVSKAHIVLTRANCNKINSVIEFSQSLGIRDIRILRLTSCGAAKDNWDTIGIPIDEQNSVIEDLIRNKHRYGVNLSFAGYPTLSPCRPFNGAKGCEAGIKLLYIDIYGDVYPCACVKGKGKICNIKEHNKVLEYIKFQKSCYRTQCLNVLQS